MTYKVAVLIAIYKAGRFIDRKLRDLRNQTMFGDCQMILLNCQNLDNESEIYREFTNNKNVVEITYNEHKNLYATWNDGIKASDSVYISNSNVDDLFVPEYYAKLSSALDNNDCGISHSDYYVTSVPNQIYPNWEWYSTMPTMYPNGTVGPSPLWRRSLHNRYGYFDDLRVISDALMWERWVNGGEKFYHVDEYLGLYYQGGNLESRRDENGILLRDLDLREYYE